jgi:hypothetical protein
MDGTQGRGEKLFRVARPKSSRIAESSESRRTSIGRPSSSTAQQSLSEVYFFVIKWTTPVDSDPSDHRDRIGIVAACETSAWSQHSPGILRKVGSKSELASPRRVASALASQPLLARHSQVQFCRRAKALVPLHTTVRHVEGSGRLLGRI